MSYAFDQCLRRLTGNLHVGVASITNRIRAWTRIKTFSYAHSWLRLAKLSLVRKSPYIYIYIYISSYYWSSKISHRVRARQSESCKQERIASFTDLYYSHRDFRRAGTHHWNSCCWKDVLKFHSVVWFLLHRNTQWALFLRKLDVVKYRSVFITHELPVNEYAQNAGFIHFF